MSFEATVLEVLIASPGDVEQERDEIEQAIYDWNSQYGRDLGIVLIPRRWENDFNPGYSRYHDTQGLLNKQFVHGADFVIGVFWSKLGSPTQNFPSGTLEELDHFISTGKEVMLYFVDRPIPMSTARGFSEATKVIEYRSKYQESGLYGIYKGKVQVKDHLYSMLRKYKRSMSIPEKSKVPSLYTPEVTAEIAKKVENTIVNENKLKKGTYRTFKDERISNLLSGTVRKMGGFFTFTTNQGTDYNRFDTPHGIYIIKFYESISGGIVPISTEEGEIVVYYSHQSITEDLTQKLNSRESIEVGDVIIWKYPNNSFITVKVLDYLAKKGSTDKYIYGEWKVYVNS